MSVFKVMARQVAPWTLLLALLLRGMIPGGYMPNLNPDNGEGWLVICTSVGSASIQMDGADGDGAAPADTAHQGLCPFMGMTLLGPVLLLLALLLPAVLDAVIRSSFTPLRRRRLWCGPTLGARAPPLSWAC
ncbi:DUF2946 family protein [Niveispirillum lacus]|uniref:DUF2946 family protein n=1 Tax=Niveispirillum lacus TaxID=1981099 RepID=UPI001A9C2D8E|nr:DUF2946 family protein [Niveispirillum lacus]